MNLIKTIFRIFNKIQINKSSKNTKKYRKLGYLINFSAHVCVRFFVSCLKKYVLQHKTGKILRKGYILLLFARAKGVKICVYQWKILILHPILVTMA